MNTRGIVVLCVALVAGCTQWLSTADCTRDSDCHSGYCRVSEGICAEASDRPANSSSGTSSGARSSSGGGGTSTASGEGSSGESGSESGSSRVSSSGGGGACARGDEAACGRVVLAATRPAGFKPAWPPKSSVLRPGSAVLTQQASPGLVLLSTDGTLTPAVETVGKPGSPPTTVPPVTGGAPALLVVSFSDGGEFRFFGGPSALVEDLPSANPGTPHLLSLVHAAPGGPFVVGISTQGALAAVHAHTNRPAVGRLTSTDHSDASWVARLCSAGRGNLVVQDTRNRVAVVDVTSGAQGPVLTEVGGVEAQDNPSLPPVVFDDAAGTAHVFVFHASGDTARLHHVVVDGTDVSVNTDDSQATLVHGAALVWDPARGGQPRIMVPTATGTLLLADPVADALNITELDPDTAHQDVLSGVVAARLGEAGSAPTLFFGDAAGRVFAMRDGVVLAGWPKPVAQGAVVQSPAVVADAAGTQLFLVVVSESQGGGWVTLLGLGEPATPGWALWPEFQHDSANSGCVSAP